MIDFPSPDARARTAGAPFTSADWLYKVKHNGYRCLAGVEQGDAARVQLRTKSGANCTAWFPEIARGLVCIPPAGRM